jgi:large subunit ribosomal protein L5
MSLKQRYRETIQPKLLKDLSLSNIHEVPKVLKVTVNRGLGEAATNAKSLEASVNELAQITGQKVVITRAKKAIAAFKIRQGMPIGCAVTLRGDRMYAFLERFINLALPRIRDFRGVSPKSFDGRGNYTVGVREQIIFPEISFDKIDAIRGMDITIVTSARTDEEGRALLREMGMPFRSNRAPLGNHYG